MDKPETKAPKAKADKPETKADYSYFGDMVHVEVSKDSKHLTKGDLYHIGKDTAILLLERGLVKLA